MIKVSITVEATNGLTWPHWQRLVKAAEELGFYGLYRSDHYTSPQPPDRPALELWVSLTWLADHTRRIHFGPLVSPVSYRHPTMTAKMAGAVDDLSDGRLVLGIGAGGWAREHAMFGLELLAPPDRLRKFAEGVEVIRTLLHSEQPSDFHGRFFQLKQAILLPRPQRPGGPPLLIGGNGKKHTLPLAARFADEWNGVYLTAQNFSVLNSILDELLAQEQRPAQSVRRSVLTGCITGANRKEIEENATRWLPKDLNEEQIRAVLMGSGGAIVEQIGALGEAGVQEVMLVWFDLQDLAGLERLAKDVLPHFSGPSSAGGPTTA